ncbi:MAG TPA: CDP-alcohol phosphatidyltransferase family protein [Thermoanaerobaculia bacterium]|nr:CDP-alcohol phosphatidyltransferase family protein [Thermoanaerobaculia bacterium]
MSECHQPDSAPATGGPLRSPVTIPNLLSLLRMGLTPLFVISVLNGQPAVALAVFVMAGVTDALDGFIARTYGQQSKLGAYLDPIADKLLLMSAYVALAIPGLHRGAPIPVWVTVLVIARDLIIVIVALILYLALGRTRFPPSVLSKVNTAVQVMTAIVVLASGVWLALVPAAEWAAYAVAATTVASGIDYIVRANLMASAERREEAQASRVESGHGGG